MKHVLKLTRLYGVTTYLSSLHPLLQCNGQQRCILFEMILILLSSRGWLSFRSFAEVINAFQSLTTEESWFADGHGQPIFFYIKPCRPTVTHTSRLLDGKECFSPGVKRVGCEADHLLPFNAEMTSEWI
jgi:hypothetical protein